MKLNLLSGILLLVSLSSHATDYYFSATSGSDKYTTNSINTPWSSVDKLNTIHPRPGDRFMLKSGDFFHGGIVTNSDGTYSQPITFTTYGGSKPAVISGVSLLTEWEPVGNNIWRSGVLPMKTMHNVMVDGKQVEMGRYPNNYPSTGGFLVYQYFTNSIGSTTIHSSQLGDYGIDASWTGATLKVKSYLSTLENARITAIQGDGITFDNSNMFYQLGYNNCGFYLTNSIKTLDLPTEWYYNPADSRLYMYFADKPTDHIIEMSHTDALFQINNDHYRIDNLVFKGANAYCIAGNWPGLLDLSVGNSQFLNSGVTAIALANFRKVVIDKCVVKGANTSGINVGYNCDSVYITNSTIRDIGMLSANIWCDAMYQRRMGYAIYSGRPQVKGLTAINNTIDNVAYIGLFFCGSNNYIYKNTLTNTCLLLDDGGAIYYGNKEGEGINNVIRRNIILNCQGNIMGFTTARVIPNAIFLDDNSSYCTVDSNYVEGVGEACIYVHNGYECTITNNTFVNAGLANIMLQDDVLGARVQRIVIKHNTVVNTIGNRLYCFYSSGNSTDNAIPQFATIDSNYLYANQTIVGHEDTFNVKGVKDYTFKEWITLTRFDLHSTLFPTTSTVKTFYTTDSSRTFTLNGEWLRPNGTPYGNTIRLEDHSSIVLIQNIPITLNK